MAVSEHQMQVALAGFLNHALPIDTFWTAIDAAGNGPSEGAKKKARGVRRGTPDILIVHKPYTIWIELKKNTGVSPHQERAMHLLRENGHRCHVCYSVEDVETLLRGYEIPLRATTMTAKQRDEALAARAAVPKAKGAPRKRKPSVRQIARTMAAFYGPHE